MGIENTGNIVLIIGEWTRKNVVACFPCLSGYHRACYRLLLALGFLIMEAPNTKMSSREVVLFLFPGIFKNKIEGSSNSWLS